jgi:hypothetical protein
MPQPARHSLAEISQATSEHHAWLAAMSELKRLGIDINQEDRLHALLVAWGEELAELRDFMDLSTQQRLLGEARAKVDALGDPPLADVPWEEES